MGRKKSKKGAGATPAIRSLETAGADFQVHTYDPERVPFGPNYAQRVAEAVGRPPAQLFKTLLIDVDGAAQVAVVPGDRDLDLKALARAAGGRRARVLPPSDAERLTGYQTGGISPFGQKKRLPVWLDDSAERWETIVVSAGRRGLQIEVVPAVLMEQLPARMVLLTSE